jgi:hypothetical protein
MLLRQFPIPVRLLTAGLMALVGVSLAQAGQRHIPCRCSPTPEVFHSEFFGYYRTCWRPWPGGQPPCPPYVVGTVEIAVPAEAPEKLPSAKPEPAPAPKK